jgi:tRNA pseudouridine38-40 synthase
VTVADTVSATGREYDGRVDNGPVRIRLDLAYLGTSFEGWQAQETLRDGAPPRTVQGELEAAVASLYGRHLPAVGAGRTDSGVHANGQVAHFDVPAGAPHIPPEGLRRGLNSVLPEDVRVFAASGAPDDFHARFSAAGKIYVYRLRRGEFLHPHRGLVEALAKEPLDVGAMREAARHLVGRRDFAPFSISGSNPDSTVRNLARLDVEEEGDLLVIRAVGDGFLRGMVRRLVGTLREAGRAKMPPEEAGKRPGPTAEARGLTLEHVLYPPERLPEAPETPR